METMKQRFVTALELRGSTRVLNARSNKYLVYTTTRKDRFYFIGPSGALRYGQTVATSHPVNAATKTALLDSAAFMHTQEKANRS